MDHKNIAKLIVLKVACCGILIFLLLGGIGLMTALSTSNIIFSAAGTALLLWTIYKISVVTMDKYKKV